jgi:hypothetical protein
MFAPPYYDIVLMGSDQRFRAVLLCLSILTGVAGLVLMVLFVRSDVSIFGAMALFLSGTLLGMFFESKSCNQCVLTTISERFEPVRIETAVESETSIQVPKKA